MLVATSKSRLAGVQKWLMGAAVGGLLTMRLAVNPKPAARPRVTPHGTYYLKGHAESYRLCQEEIAKQRPGSTWHDGPLTGPLAVAIECVVQRPKKTILSAPRGDVDNFAKTPLDSCTKQGVWGDDTQVEVLVASKRWTEDGEEPHLNIHIARIVT